MELFKVSAKASAIICAVLLGSVASHQVALCTSPPPMVSIHGAFSPANPVSVVETPSASLSAALSDPGMNQEILPPPGSTFQWAVNRETSTAPAGAQWGVSFQPADAPATVATASFDTAGSYTIGITVTVHNDAWASDATADALFSFQVNDVVVRFSPSPIVTGYSKNDPGYIYVEALATVPRPTRWRTLRSMYRVQTVPTSRT